VSDDSVPLRLTETDKWYAKTALEMLTKSYEEQGDDDHASKTRQLCARVEAHTNDRKPYQAADAAKWQQALVQSQADPTRIKQTLREWWSEILLQATDPAGTLADSVMPLIDQSVHQSVGQILTTINEKMRALVNDPNLSSDDRQGPEQALAQLFQFVQGGLEDLQAGKPLWVDDPHLQQIAAQARAQPRQ
jgi:hypothetical protein